LWQLDAVLDVSCVRVAQVVASLIQTDFEYCELG